MVFIGIQRLKSTIYILIIILTACCKNQEVTEDINVQKTENNFLIQKKPDLRKNDVPHKRKDTVISVSKLFVVNKIECYWELKFIAFEGNDFGEGTLELKNVTKNILLNNSRTFSFNDSYYQHTVNNFHFESFTQDSMEDLNFDGLMDFKIFDKYASGSAGMFYSAYIFNPYNKIFELNEHLSGYELEVNRKEKTLSSYAKNGHGYNISSISHFDKNGRITYEELIEREVFHKDTADFVKTTHQRIINNKTVEKKVYTEPFEGW